MEQERKTLKRGIFHDEDDGVNLSNTKIIAWDLNEAWFLSLRAIMRHGFEYKIDRGSYQGSRRKELDFVMIHILHPGIRPLPPIVSAGVPAPTNDEAIENYMKYLLTSEKAPNETYTYGQDIEVQFPEAIRMLKEDGPNTNQACISVGDARSIFLPDPQCLRVIDWRVRYGKLHYIVQFRSWEAYAGLPMNLGGIQKMKELAADEIGVEDGNLIAVSKGLHLYEYSWEWARAVLRMDI